MMNIREILQWSSLNQSCNVQPSQGLPVVGPNWRLPDDLKEFYSVCGGLDIAPRNNWGWRIVEPNEFIRADQVVLPGYSPELYCLPNYGPSEALFLMAVRGCGPDYISIDLAPERLGRCYDSYHDCHATDRSCIVALSFTELVNRIIEGLDARESFWCSYHYGHYRQDDAKPTKVTGEEICRSRRRNLP